MRIYREERIATKINLDAFREGRRNKNIPDRDVRILRYQPRYLSFLLPSDTLLFDLSGHARKYDMRDLESGAFQS